jgi:para-nitrobenzyl esterase
MASPLAQGLFQRAIGESGAFFSTGLKPRARGDDSDLKFAEAAFGTTSLEKLRAIPAADFLEKSLKQTGMRFAPNIDGYFLPESVPEIFAAGRQAHVPLLAGWNLDEGSYRQFFGHDEPTAANFAAHARTQFGDDAAEFLKLYPAETDAQARRSAQDLAGDRFIAYGTWKWIEAQNSTGKSPVYRYEFDQTMPLSEAQAQNPNAQPTAPHASEIEFVFQMLDAQQLPWRPEDRKVSDLMSSYWTNFAKTGDPNGPGLPEWPVYKSDTGYPVMHFSADSHSAPDEHHARYEFLDRVWSH